MNRYDGIVDTDAGRIQARQNEAALLLLFLQCTNTSQQGMNSVVLTCMNIFKHLLDLFLKLAKIKVALYQKIGS